MLYYFDLILILILSAVCVSIHLLRCVTIQHINTKGERDKRYLIFTQATQWGVFATVSVPLNPETLVSVAWFFEANYYAVDNSTWFQPLLGDIQVSRSKQARSTPNPTALKNMLTRKLLYTSVQTMLENHGFPGRVCLLRAICENADSHFLHNGVLGDVLHLILTPSTSVSEEDVDDSYYEAEYLGLEGQCERYHIDCPASPLQLISIDYTEG